MGPAFHVFLSRLTSSLVLWGLCAATMYWAYEPGLWALLILLVLRGLWEFFSMLSAASLPHFKRTGMFLGAVLCIGSLAIAKWRGCNAAIHFEVGVFAFGVLWIFTRQIARKSPEPLPVATIAYTVLGLAYIPLLASFTANLLYVTPPTAAGQLSGHFYLLFLAVVTKFSDCGAYLSGSLFGKHLMIPHISPKKTWEGFAGAIALSIFGALALLRIFPQQLSHIAPSHGVVLGLVLSLSAVVGDLAESVIKRSTGIKDSGHFLPGIGGAMDLIDSLLFTGPILYFYLHFVSGT